MKTLNKFLAASVITIMFTLTANNTKAQSTNDNALIGRAQGAAHECINEARQPGYEISGQIETIGICFNGGFITKVTFYKTPVCHQEPCPRPIAEPVAEVTFGCEGEIINVQCL